MHAITIFSFDTTIQQAISIPFEVLYFLLNRLLYPFFSSSISTTGPLFASPFIPENESFFF
eukprot:UN08159